MKKRLSKRRIWARLMMGQKCRVYDLVLHNLDLRAMHMGIKLKGDAMMNMAWRRSEGERDDG